MIRVNKKPPPIMTRTNSPRPRWPALDGLSTSPLYRTVQQKILQLLATGEWKPGDRLPNDDELASQFGVASSTLRAGLADLASAGLLDRRPGRGTYVARHKPYGEQLRYSNIYDAAQDKVNAPRTIVSLRHRMAVPEWAALLKLDLRPRPKVCEVQSLLTKDGEPVAGTTIILPLPLFSRLTKKALAESDENLYSVYQRQCGVTVLRMEERISARCADAKSAKRLEVKVGHPLLCVQRIAYSYNDTPVEIRYRTYEGLKHHYLFTHESL
jgi:GntR family transcriptional regulator